MVALTLLGASCACVGCADEGEAVVERWEDLAEILHEKREDCGTLADDLSAFREEHGAFFSEEMRPIYDEIAEDPALRVRLERAFANLEVAELPCLEDEAVQAQAKELFGGLVSAESE